MALRTHITDITPYITRDGSEIRELMHPSVQGNKTQSLAEAIQQGFVPRLTMPEGGK